MNFFLPLSFDFFRLFRLVRASPRRDDRVRKNRSFLIWFARRNFGGVRRKTRFREKLIPLTKVIQRQRTHFRQQVLRESTLPSDGETKLGRGFYATCLYYSFNPTRLVPGTIAWLATASRPELSGFRHTRSPLSIPQRFHPFCASIGKDCSKEKVCNTSLL